MDVEVKKHKNIARFVALLGIIPGIWFLIATHTKVGEKLQIGCGYWIITLVILTAIWVMYAILTKILTKDIGVAHDNANSLSEQRHYKLLFISTVIESLIASIIFALSLVGFLATDLQCYLSKGIF